jgi:hypothetical protein
MIPVGYHQLAQQIYQERIQAAQAQRPEWAYSLPDSGRPPARSLLHAWLQNWLPARLFVRGEAPGT